MNQFLKYSIPTILFFIIGDFITTLVGLQQGFTEYNPIVSKITGNWAVFLGAKFLVLPVLYILYRTVDDQVWVKRYFAIPAVGGLLLVINNTWQLLGL